MLRRISQAWVVTLISVTAASGATLRAGMYNYGGGAASYALYDSQQLICDECPPLAPLQAAPQLVVLALNTQQPLPVLKPEIEPAAEIDKAATSKNTTVITKSKIITAYFKFDSAKLSREEKNKLKKALQEEHGAFAIRVEGHTCKIGDKTYNDRLSALRAQSVARFLSSQGVTVTDVKSFGSSKPGNGTLAQNRRAEILVEEKP